AIRGGVGPAQRVGLSVDSFQLDEIWPTATESTPDGRAALQFLRGVLVGLHAGRAVLGDKPMQGLVHIAHPKALASRADADAKAFLRSLETAASHVVGETYPSFSGDPRASARQQLAPRD